MGYLILDYSVEYRSCPFCAPNKINTGLCPSYMNITLMGSDTCPMFFFVDVSRGYKRDGRDVSVE